MDINAGRKLTNDLSMTTIKVYFDGLTQDSRHLQDGSALHQLLTFGQVRVSNTNTATQSLQELLCNDCGLNNDAADCPVAALAHFGETDASSNTTTYWLLVTPVHLTLQRDFFSMTATLTPSNADSLSFIASLNAHFADDGYIFSLTPSQQWLLKLPQRRKLLTLPCSQVIGRDTRPYMPKGEDVTWAAQLTNEIQMLLFEHPINQTREARGELAVNSIWLSGTGALPETLGSITSKSIYADNAFVKGVAKLAKLPSFAMPQSIDQLLTHIKIEGKSTVETIGWIDIADTPNDWFTEILQLLRKRKLKRIQLYLERSGKVLELTLTDWDMWKFWRKRRPLNTYFPI